MPAAPQVPEALRRVADIAVESGDRWEALEIQADLRGQSGEDLDVSGCWIRGSHLGAIDIERARIVDTVFEQCDLSGAVLADLALTRVRFVDCRLSGADLAEARLADVHFEECRLNDASLRMAAGERVLFERCDLGRVDLYACRLAGARVYDSDLTGATLSKADLTGARLHGSRLDGVLGPDALRGATIDSTQVVPVANALMGVFSITVDDEREPPSG
jgi:uncharacterized protein YjbI with pentapeptide repeats